MITEIKANLNSEEVYKKIRGSSSKYGESNRNNLQKKLIYD